MDEMSKNMSFEYPEKPKFLEQETGHVYFDTGVDESTEVFAKNVKLTAHTEYTSHKNGKIGEGGDVDGNAYAVIVDANDEVVEGEYDKAKKYFLAEKTVVIVMRNRKGNVVDSAAVITIEEPYTNPNGVLLEGALITHNVPAPDADYYFEFGSDNIVYRRVNK